MATGLVTAPIPAAAQPPTPTPKLGQAALANPEQALGKAWQKSSDVMVTGVGDSKGFHLFVAREKDAFAWKTLATLTAPAIDLGPWMGEVCVTGSGRYAVALFAPKMAANRPSLVQAGGLAAVVDIATGKARHVATGLELAYFNPACGPTDRALLTRSIGDVKMHTDLITVDAAAGRITETKRVDGQLTTPAPAVDGDYGIVSGRLVRVEKSGKLTKLAKPSGQPFAVNATSGNGIDVASVRGDKAIAQRFRSGKLTTIATGPSDKFQLFGQGGRSVLVGQASMAVAKPAEMTRVEANRQVRAVSGQVHVVVEELLSQQARRSTTEPLSRPIKTDAGAFQVKVRPASSQTATTSAVGITNAPRLAVDLETPAARAAGAASRSRANALGPGPVDPPIPTPVCAIPRNDPKIQALQPSPDMVEWAIDQAVHGKLTTKRPANYLKSGLPAYAPQTMFKKDDLAGGGEVPAQVMLGIVAQETNMSQASWHQVPGDTGNPLIADYWGNGQESIDVIDFSKTDCGYGIGQVTTGMTVHENDFSREQQVAIAIDYAANISAGLNILIDKWNQIYTEPEGRSWVNNNDPKYVQNWFLAVWAYNSGYHTSLLKSINNGRWGLGWLNNPANPRYPATRHSFLRYTYADAETPNRWPYPERIMGWIENPQLKGITSVNEAYAQPTYGQNSPYEDIIERQVLKLPDNRLFCNPAINSCDPNASSPCPADSEACWWRGSATFADCDKGECATEKLTYGAGAAEPEVKRIYERTCTPFDGSKDPSYTDRRATKVVYNLPDPGQYALGCATQENGGKFTIRGGARTGSIDSLYAQIDLHQQGVGYQGHSWFSHVYGPEEDGDRNSKHFLVGSWTPDLPLNPGERARFDVVVHLPSHGGEYDYANYLITRGYDPGYQVEDACTLDQSTSPWYGGNGVDKWVYLGAFDLGRGSQVQLTNEGVKGDNGTVDIAWDAMAFIPLSAAGSSGHKCGQTFP